MITPEQIAAAGSETAHQSAVFVWAGLNRKKYPMLEWLHAIPNANSHKQVREGVKGGVPDMCLPFPVWEHAHLNPIPKRITGLYIELKIPKRRNEKNGGRSDDQIKWIDYLNSVGYYATTAYGWDEAVKVIIDYLEGRLRHE